MKYCDNCGKELNENFCFCPNCGKNFFAPNQNQQKSSSALIIVCAIVGLLFPLIGAILYYVLKETDIKAAKTANSCAWISFLAQLIFGFLILLML